MGRSARGSGRVCGAGVSRLPGILLCAATFLGTSTVTAQTARAAGKGVGEIVNPSFEDPAGFLTGWSHCLAGESSIKRDPSTQQPVPRFHDGQHSAGMSSDRPGDSLAAGAIFQEVQVTPGRTYRVRFWGAMTDDDDYTDDFVELRIRDGNSAPIDCAGNGANVESNSALYAHLAGQPQTQWVALQGDIIPTGNVVTIIAYWKFRGTLWAVKSLHLDDWSMEDITPSVVQFGNFQASRAIAGAAYDLTITYTTVLPVTTQIEWGPTTSYGQTSPLDPAEVTQHVVQLAGVTPEPVAYHYRVHATASGSVNEFSADQTFHAPKVELSGIEAFVHGQVATVCTVTWTTNYATTDNQVYYRPTGGGAYAEVAGLSDPQPLTDHIAVIEPLALDTSYEFYVQSGAADIIVVTSAVQSFATPVQAAPPVEIGMAMIGGDLADAGDDVGPANEIRSTIERDHPAVTISGMTCTSWRNAQPDDPGSGPDVYDWSELDAGAARLIPGKALLSYYQMWGTSPDWADLEGDPQRFWQKFEAFIKAMTVHINQNYGAVYYVFENEPNISRAPDGWSWDDWYIYCVQHFHAGVHAANNQTGIANKVIAGNLCGHSAGGFENLYYRGLKNYSDLLGYHPYPFDIRDGLAVQDLAQIHSIQVRYGDDAKQIYVSEGWGSGRSAGFDRTSPVVEPIALEYENMYLALVNGWDNIMTPRENWEPDYLWGMMFFCGNDNWGAMNHRQRAIPIKNEHGDITGFELDGYSKTPDIAPYFWNGGMIDFYGNSKDCLIHVFPGDGLVFMNPGFELASDPPNAYLAHFWSADVWPALPENYALDEVVSHGGSRSLRLTRASAGSHGVVQTTAKRSVIAGVSYRARVWCKTQNVSGLAAGFYVHFCELNGMRIATQIHAPDISGTQDWQQVEIIATAPAGAQRLEVGCTLSGAGTAWFDDVTIAMTSQPELGTVRGYTLDEQQVPVANCLVKTTTDGAQTVSDENGYYEMQSVPTGTYDFVCRQAGYVPHRVRNQTVAAGKLTFVSFAMGIPKPGLSVTQIGCEPPAAVPDGDPVTVSVTVANGKPYPNVIAEVSLFIEQEGADATEQFLIQASPSNPQTIPAFGESRFDFTVAPRLEAANQVFEVNAYAFGQEDRPNMLLNGGFDAEPWGDHWTFTGGAQTLSWTTDGADYHSPPRALRCYVADDNYTYNWANNWSAYGPDAVEAHPATNYTVGVYHKDNITGGVAVDLFIQEYYYDGGDWFYNGRRFAAVPHRSVWAHDILMYETGDPNVTQGLYATNRLVVSCGPCTTPDAGSGYNWWDDLYLKETGDWLADDRAETPATLTVTGPSLIEVSTTQIDASATAGWDAPDGTFTVRYAGQGTLSYTITDDADWLRLEPATGTNTGEGDVITVVYETHDLHAGVYDARITVSDDAGGPAPRTIDVDVTVEAVAADFDGDGDVDQSDFGHLQACYTGPGGVSSDPACDDARLDQDQDVDIDDLDVFLGCSSAPDLPPDPECDPAP